MLAMVEFQFFLMGPVTFMPEDGSHYGLPGGTPSKLIQSFQQAIA
jgi:hypothetical protein